MKNPVLALLLAWTSIAACQTLPLQLDAGTPIAPSAGGVDAVQFVPNLEAIRVGADSFLVVLPGWGSVTILRSHFEDRGNGDALWRGQVLLEPSSQVLLTVRGGILVGSIQTRTRDYSITWRDEHEVLELRDRAARAGGVDLLVGFPEPKTLVPPSKADDSGPRATAEEAEIDVAVLYTNSVISKAAIEAEIQGAIDYANLTFVNSLVPAHYRLVYTALYQGSYNTGTPTLAANTGIASLLSTTGADLIALVVDGFGAQALCGIATNATVVGPPGASAALQFSSRTCEFPLAEVYTHENGHLLGMNHDPQSADLPAETAYPWSFGHQVDGQFRTVMSYPTCPSGCPVIPHFSNPSVSYNGFPTGIPDQRDNARTAGINAPLAAAYRAPGITAPPPVPSPFNAVPGATQVFLSWGTSSTASSYQIVRTSDGTNFTLVASPLGSEVSYIDTAVSSGQTYTYFMKAINALGSSPFTPPLTVTVNPPPSAPTDLTATVVSATEIRLNWTDTSFNETHFIIEKFQNGAFEAMAQTGPNATSYLLTNLSPTTEYTFRVLANDASRDLLSPPSNSATITTPTLPPPGAVSGIAFNDPNGNATPDKGETPAAGLVIFYDSNGNSIRDEVPAVFFTVTNATQYISGTNIPYLTARNYSLTDLPAGTRRICGSFYPTVASRAFCRTVSVPSGATATNVHFPVADGRVGTSFLTPSTRTVQENEKVMFNITWTHTDQLWVLLKQAHIRFALTDEEDAMQIRFDEATRTFSVYQAASGKYTPSYAAGTAATLDTNSAEFDLADTQVIGTGPTGPSVTLRIGMKFKPKIRDQTLKVLLQLEDDNGYMQGYDELGTVMIVK